MINKELVEERISLLTQLFDEIEPLLKREADKIIHDEESMREIKRLFRLIVDGSVSVNIHVITKNKFDSTENPEDTFIILARNNVFPMNFSQKIAPAVELKNQITKEDDNLSSTQIAEEIKTYIGYFQEYLILLDEYAKQA